MRQNKFTYLSIVLGAAGLLAGCAGSTQTTLSDGTVANLVECDGTTRGMNYCFERAGKTCGAADYTIVDREGNTIARSNLTDEDSASLIKQYANDQNSILVKCDR